VDLHFSVQYHNISRSQEISLPGVDPDATPQRGERAAIPEVVGRSKSNEVLVGGTRPQITKRTKDAHSRQTLEYTNGIRLTTGHSH